MEDLKFELIEGEEVAADKDGKVLIWTGSETPEQPASEPPSSSPSDSSSPTQSKEAEPKALAGERRQLTVMFCDLVGSTALSEQLDPEEIHVIVRTYQDAYRHVIERYGDHIA